MGTRTTAVMLLAIIALGWGCEAPSHPPATGLEAAAPPAWPAPPSRPRIRFVRAVSGPLDVGIRPSFWQRVGELLAGQEQDAFVRPSGVAARGRTLFVADAGAQLLWILDAAAGRVRRVREAGSLRLVSPVALALGRDDRVYVADSYLARVFVYGADGRLERTIEGGDFRRPAGVAYDGGRDRLYVADSAAHRVWILRGDGEPVGAVGRRGEGPGEFNFPTHLAVDRDGLLYVTDALGFRVQIFEPDGRFAGQFGRQGDSAGDFARPKGIAVDSEGHVYVVDALFDAVQIFDRAGQLLLGFGEQGRGRGQFWLPGGLFIDSQDRIYVADAYNQRVQIFEYLAGGDDG